MEGVGKVPKKCHILFDWIINAAFNVKGYFKTLVLKTFFIKKKFYVLLVNYIGFGREQIRLKMWNILGITVS